MIHYAKCTLKINTIINLNPYLDPTYMCSLSRANIPIITWTNTRPCASSTHTHTYVRVCSDPRTLDDNLWPMGRWKCQPVSCVCACAYEWNIFRQRLRRHYYAMCTYAWARSATAYDGELKDTPIHQSTVSRAASSKFFRLRPLRVRDVSSLCVCQHNYLYICSDVTACGDQHDKHVHSSVQHHAVAVHVEAVGCDRRSRVRRIGCEFSAKVRTLVNVSLWLCVDIKYLILFK